MFGWTLTDCRKPLDVDEEHLRLAISAEKQLRGELHALQTRCPALVFLKAASGEGLEIAIGGPYAGLTWLPPASEGDRIGSRVAIATSLVTSETIEFIAEGIEAPLDPEELFPVEEVFEATLYFYREHRLPEWISWRQWAPTTKQWDTIPSTRPAPAGVLAK